MKRRKALATTAIVMASMFVGGLVQANAAAIAKDIKALLDPSITINFRDEDQVMKDANGNDVFPVLYDGTTYLPVRAVSDMVGLDVEWDGNTRTVYIDRSEVQVLQPDTENAFDQTDNTKWTRLLSLFTNYTMFSDKLTPYYCTVNVDGVDHTFSEGIYFDRRYSTKETDAILVPVEEYTTIAFTAHVDAASSLVICDENYETVYTIPMEANTLQEVILDITDFKKVGLLAGENWGQSVEAKFFDILVK